jgi:hypothetical protein
MIRVRSKSYIAIRVAQIPNIDSLIDQAVRSPDQMAIVITQLRELNDPSLCEILTIKSETMPGAKLALEEIWKSIGCPAEQQIQPSQDQQEESLEPQEIDV